MNRRDLMKLGLLAGAGSLAAPPADAAQPAYDVVEKDLATLQADLTAGRLTTLGLTQAYLARIGRIDKAGPKLNAVLELNPEALAIARALDEERFVGAAWSEGTLLQLGYAFEQARQARKPPTYPRSVSPE